jgi:beta-alanine degradation protein BauB
MFPQIKLGAVLVAALLLAAGLAPPAAYGLPDPLQAGWAGSPVCEKLHEDPHNRILRCTFPPAVGHERHFHAPHFGYVLAGGRAEIIDASGTHTVDLLEGTSSWSDGVEWHEARNVGDTTIVYLIVEPKPAR